MSKEIKHLTLFQYINSGYGILSWAHTQLGIDVPLHIGTGLGRG